MVELHEVVVLLGLALLAAVLVVPVVYLGWGGIILDTVVLSSLGTFTAVALPHTPLNWDLPHLVPDRAWFRLMEARHNHGWGGAWGGHDWPV